MPDNSLAPPNMPWLWQPNSPVGQPNGLGPPMLNYAAPPDPTSQGAGVAAAGQQAWQWLQDQRAESVRQGLLDPDTGLPTQKGLVEGVGQTAQGVMMGTTAPGDVPPPGIVAYHGSPHSFDQFDTSKIGTGEGAQAYGHGLYFAEKEGTAQQYRDQLAGKNVGFEWNGQPVPPGQPAYDLIDTLRNQDWRLGKIAEQAAKYGPRNAVDTFEPHTRNASDGPEWQAAMDQFKQGAGKSATGSMYQVNIGADPEHFLDYDQPVPVDHPVRDMLFDASGPHVNSVYADMRNAGKDARLAARNENLTGNGAYHQLSKLLGGQEQATTALRDAGIPGIRYLDQGSRSAGQGSHNYVVFDANTIDILRKYGLAGLIAGGGAAAAGTQQQQPSQ